MRRGLALLACVDLVVALLVVVDRFASDDQLTTGAGATPADRGTRSSPLPDGGTTTPVTEPPTTTTAAPTTTTTTAPPTTTTAPPPTTEPPVAWSLVPYQGMGTWLDVYDWSAAKTGGAPPVGPADVDRMAALGVQTLFIQTAHNTIDADILEPERLLPIIQRARQVGLRVVAWYLPTLEDPATDLRRLLAAASLDVDGLAVDIESREVPDVAERNRRLVELSAAIRQALPGRVLGAIVLPPVVMEDVNPDYWPGYPWAELAPHYDVWLPMGYWTMRLAASGWRDGYRYTAENVDRVRARIGHPDAPVHPIGGIGDGSSEADVEGMRVAAAERGSLGLSLYDYRTTHDALWPVLQRARG